MLYSHMIRFKTKIWKDILQDLVKNYNDRLHSSTGFTPSHLHFANEADVERARNKLQKRNLKLIEKVKLKNSKYNKNIKVGSYVRLSNMVFKNFRQKRKTEKRGYTANWSKDIWIVL
jgi:hypothetical protein